MGAGAGGDDYFLEKKQKSKKHHLRLLLNFPSGNNNSISALVVDHHHHQLRFSDDYHTLLLEGDDDHFDHHVVVVDDDHDDDAAHNHPHHHTIYWESQQFLLQEILDQCNSSGSKLKEKIKKNIEIAKDSEYCNCMDKMKRLRGCCIKCLRRAAVNQLCDKGLNASLCTSKWKKTDKMPGGTHEYIEVIACTQGRRKQIPLLVELAFRDEFRMAKASHEYNKLIDQLPEIYTGKLEHLNAIIRVVCEAAKKSADEHKIHMGPWRKRSFMQMKWSASNQRRRSFDYYPNSNQVLVTSSAHETTVNAAAAAAMASTFQLPMPSTVKVA
ncbi:hypothetical protein Salat_2755300 [Sesamum alatum]|uniref:Uncharacterized protein n=1 Tax=Sesamum alatum TaxID=300844 RepID=A0AAE1XL35_9LAMI|nr:hypothetical protein Salat_2755300 [Sesamum alatum]